MTPETFLRALFVSNTKAANYYAKFPLYEGDELLRAKPWWPPLAEVWKVGETCPESFPSPEFWRAAWEFLNELHTQFLEAKKHAKL
jgi:hypothetical protein